MGKSLHIKTDNGPSYTSTAFKAFVPPTKFFIPQAYPAIPKVKLCGTSSSNFKQKTKTRKGDSSLASQINKALFTLNF
jgi:hypothetical protein